MFIGKDFQVLDLAQDLLLDVSWEREELPLAVRVGIWIFVIHA